MRLIHADPSGGCAPTYDVRGPDVGARFSPCGAARETCLPWTEPPLKTQRRSGTSRTASVEYSLSLRRQQPAQPAQPGAR